MAVAWVMLATAPRQTAADLPRPEAAIVRCDPVTLSSAVGLTASVTIFVQDVADLYGLDVRLLFDPAVVQVIDADPTAAGVQIEPLGGFLAPDFVVRRTADNTTGLVRYAATQVFPSQPVSGSGAVARIDLVATRPGIVTVPFTQVELVSNDGGVIPVTTQACTWQFSQRHYLPLVMAP